MVVRIQMFDPFKKRRVYKLPIIIWICFSAWFKRTSNFTTDNTSSNAVIFYVVLVDYYSE